MSAEDEYRERVREIVKNDPRYRVEAYDFVRQAVSFTGDALRAQGRKTAGRFHISGGELLEGIRELAIQQFGTLAIDVLAEWGITSTEDFGNIVFALVNNSLLGASDEDSPEDFAHGYDFTEVFVKPFVETGDLPRNPPKIA